MKSKSLLFLLLLIASTAMSQTFVGGGFDYNRKQSTVNDEKNDPTTSFSINPFIGKYLTDNFALGAFIRYNSSKSTEFINYENLEHKTNLTQFGVLMRQNMYKYNNFTLFAEGTIGIGFGKTEYDNSGSDTKSDLNTFAVSMVPKISYTFGQKFQLEAALNFFSLGFHSVTSNMEDEDYEHNYKEFNFGANSNDLINTSNFTIGFTFLL